MISDDLLKAMCKDAGISKGIYDNDRFLFTLKQVNNFYYDGTINIENICDGFVDGSGDGGIDFMLIKGEQLILVQGKTGYLNKDDIQQIFDKTKLTISKIENNDFSQLKKDMVSNFLNMRGNLQDPNNIKLVLFCKEEIDEILQRQFEAYDKYNSQYEIEIVDQSEIEERIAELDPNKKVEFGEIKIDDANNILNYGHGIIVNVSANSLKTLCVQNSKKGLFSFNLRGKISGIKVDNNIENTIANERDEFWYRNNGITIGCEDFCINKDTNAIELHQFSIINGAQTTTNILNSDNVTKDKDFSVVCKIIRTPDNLNMEEAKDYLQKISIASNSQKPITPQDIRANDVVQVSLRQKAMSNSLPFEIAIKRPIIYEIKKFETWQQIDNTVLGQLILSCICQVPGLAKTSKSKIMEDDKLYAYVFSREYDVNNYYDLLILYKKFNAYKNNQRRIINEMDESEKTEEIINQFYICKEGVLSVLAIIYNLISIVKPTIKVVAPSSPLEASKEVKEINFATRIFKEKTYDEIDNKIEELFGFIIENLSSIYNDKHVELELSNQAYFLKNNTNYSKYIIPKFEEIYNQKMNGKFLRDLMSEIFNLY